MGDAGHLTGAAACAELRSDSYSLRGHCPRPRWHRLGSATGEGCTFETPPTGIGSRQDSESMATVYCHALLVRQYCGEYIMVRWWQQAGLTVGAIAFAGVASLDFPMRSCCASIGRSGWARTAPEYTVVPGMASYLGCQCHSTKIHDVTIRQGV